MENDVFLELKKKLRSNIKERQKSISDYILSFERIKEDNLRTYLPTKMLGVIQIISLLFFLIFIFLGLIYTFEIPYFHFIYESELSRELIMNLDVDILIVRFFFISSLFLIVYHLVSISIKQKKGIDELVSLQKTMTSFVTKSLEQDIERLHIAEYEKEEVD
jgi:hypothetical protein